MPPYPANPNYTAADFLATKQQQYASRDVIISCGCVPVDRRACKIAILREHSDPEIVSLPKGRKNIDEDLHTAALRETYEETGYRFSELRLKNPTHATRTPGHAGYVAGVNPTLCEDVFNSEVSSISMYPDPSTGCLKIVFWFVAEGDSSSIPDDNTREEWEMNTAVEWLHPKDALESMSFDSDKRVIQKVLSDLESSGYPMTDVSVQ